MPVMDGIEALKIYRFTHAEEQAIPVIMLSADVTPKAKGMHPRGCGRLRLQTHPWRSLLESLGRVVSEQTAFDARQNGRTARDPVRLSSVRCRSATAARSSTVRFCVSSRTSVVALRL